MRYVTRPNEVEAIEVARVIRCARSEWDGLPGWVIAAYEAGDLMFTSEQIYLGERIGGGRAKLGDWIIKGHGNTVTHMPADIFAATYEPAPAEPNPDYDHERAMGREPAPDRSEG